MNIVPAAAQGRGDLGKARWLGAGSLATAGVKAQILPFATEGKADKSLKTFGYHSCSLLNSFRYFFLCISGYPRCFPSHFIYKDCKQEDRKQKLSRIVPSTVGGQI